MHILNSLYCIKETVAIDCLCLLLVADDFKRPPRLSFSSMQDWNRVRDKAREVITSNNYTTIDGNLR
jgi:hypothetical protein